MYRILLVDDDPHIQKTNTTFLKKQGYQVLQAENGFDALKIANSAALDAIILDVDMPELDGIQVCKQLREVSNVPIIFLSAYAKTDDRIRGLLAGGDDYMAKPYSLVELELRLRLRINQRHSVEQSKILCFKNLEIDLSLREVRYGDKIGSFTALEFDLLAFLASNPNQVFSYEQLHDRVWKAPINQGLHNIQVCAARVRQKLDKLCPNMNFIETVRGKGYLFRNIK